MFISQTGVPPLLTPNSLLPDLPLGISSGPDQTQDFNWLQQWPSEISDSMEWSAQFIHPVYDRLNTNPTVSSVDNTGPNRNRGVAYTNISPESRSNSSPNVLSAGQMPPAPQ